MSSSLANNKFQIIYRGCFIVLYRASCPIIWDKLSYIMGRNELSLVQVVRNTKDLGVK